MKRFSLIAVLFFVFIAVEAQVSQKEKEALVALYNETEGIAWLNQTNWNTDKPVSTWYGVTVTNVNGVEQINTLNLYNNNLYGELPSQLGDLTELVLLNFPGNKLHGKLPAELNNLRKLKVVNISGNSIDTQVVSQLLEKIIINDNSSDTIDGIASDGNNETQKGQDSSIESIAKITIKKEITSSEKLLISSFLKSMEFMGDPSELSVVNKQKLDKIASVLELTTNRFVIEIHVANHKSKEKNKEIADELANSLKSYLEKIGISKDRMKALGIGEENKDEKFSSDFLWTRKIKADFVFDKVIKTSDGVIEKQLLTHASDDGSVRSSESYIKIISFKGSLILPETASELKSIAKSIQDNGISNFSIKAYTDRLGSDEVKIELSREIANSIKAYLVSLGVNPNRLTSFGLGGISIESLKHLLNKDKNTIIIIKGKMRVSNFSSEDMDNTPLHRKDIGLKNTIDVESSRDSKEELPAFTEPINEKVEVEDTVVPLELIEKVKKVEKVIRIEKVKKIENVNWKETKKKRKVRLFSFIKQPPIHLECNQGNVTARKQCFERLITRHLEERLSIDEFRKLGLKQQQQVVSYFFEIDKKGKVQYARVNASHDAIAKNVKSSIQTIPQLIPARQDNNVVAVIYMGTLVFSLGIDDEIEVTLNDNNQEIVEFIGTRIPSNLTIQMVDSAPVFPGCENKNGVPLMKCTIEKINKKIKTSINHDNLKELSDSKDPYESIVSFIITNQGDVFNINIQNSNKVLRKEIERSVKSLPKMGPALYEGVLVPISYRMTLKLVYF